MLTPVGLILNEVLLLHAVLQSLASILGTDFNLCPLYSKAYNKSVI